MSKKLLVEGHVCTSYRFETYQEMETRTIDQLKAKYDSAMTIKDEVETVMMKMAIRRSTSSSLTNNTASNKVYNAYKK